MTDPRAFVPRNFQSGALQQVIRSSPSAQPSIKESCLESAEKIKIDRAAFQQDESKKEAQVRLRTKKVSPARVAMILNHTVILPPAPEDAGKKVEKQGRFSQRRKTQPSSTMQQLAQLERKNTNELLMPERLPTVEDAEVAREEAEHSHRSPRRKVLPENLEVLDNLNIMNHIQVYNLVPRQVGPSKFKAHFSTLHPEGARPDVHRADQDPARTGRSRLEPPLSLPGVRHRRKQSQGIIEDTRQMFQRKRLQDIKKYNRELLLKHRKDQIELQKLSQYLKVKNLYKVAQEKVQRNFQMEVQSFLETAEMIDQVVEQKETPSHEAEAVPSYALDEPDAEESQQESKV